MDTLWNLREMVRQVKPNTTAELADQYLNKHIQNTIKKRRWSDLLKVYTINVPAVYNTGTVSTTSGLDTIAGTGTAWPVADSISGSLAQAIRAVPGVVKIYPDAATLLAVRQGDYLVLDLGQTSQEVIIVNGVSVDHFRAYCSKAHAVAATITKSSLSNRQISLPSNQVATIKAVFTSTSMQLDQVAAGAPIANGPYFICLRYVRIGNSAYRILDAVDPVAGVQVGTAKTWEWLNSQDPQRTTTGTDSLELISMAPNPGGVMQWELWPAQTSQYIIQVFFQDGFPKLVASEDLSPFFINEQVFVSLAQADAYFTKVIPSAGKQDPYYDPIVGKMRMEEGNQLLEEAIQQDEGRYLSALTNWQQSLRGAVGNTAYDANHLVDQAGFSYI